MWSPAVVWRRRSRLLPAGRPHPVQELQRTPHPGPLGQNLHRLLTNLYLNLFAPGLTDPRTAGTLLIAACSLTVSVENRYFYFLLTSVRLLPLHFLYSLVHRLQCLAQRLYDSGLTCRQLGLHFIIHPLRYCPHIPCTCHFILLLTLSKTMKAHTDVTDFNLKIRIFFQIRDMRDNQDYGLSEPG